MTKIIFLLIGITLGYLVRYFQDKRVGNNGPYDGSNYLWGRDESEQLGEIDE